MSTTFHTPAHLTFPSFSPKSMLMRMLAAIAAAERRAKTRRDYRYLLSNEAVMRDIGVDPTEIRAAIKRLDDRN